MNGQPWSFIVIRDQAIKGRLADIKDAHCPPEKSHYSASMLREAPVVIVVCVDLRTSHERNLESAVLAASQLMLAAHGKGLGSVFMTAYRDGEPGVTRQISELLAIPASARPMILLPLGYPDEIPAEKKLKPIEDMVFHEQYGKHV